MANNIYAFVGDQRRNYSIPYGDGWQPRWTRSERCVMHTSYTHIYIHFRILIYCIRWLFLFCKLAFIPFASYFYHCYEQFPFVRRMYMWQWSCVSATLFCVYEDKSWMFRRGELRANYFVARLVCLSACTSVYLAAIHSVRSYEWLVWRNGGRIHNRSLLCVCWRWLCGYGYTQSHTEFVLLDMFAAWAWGNSSKFSM